MTLAAAILVLILVFLSGMHWYWLFGGALSPAVVPDDNGRAAFQPGPLSTSAVALALLGAAWLGAAHAEFFGLERTATTRIGVIVLALLFGLRAIGDFRLVGFFKRVRGTAFARMDSLVYAPLCVVISALCSVVLWLSP